MRSTLILPITLSAVSAFYQGDLQQPFLSQESNDQYNVLKFLGGLGPYVDRQGSGISRDPPAGCKVDQVHMIHRHGERYPASTDREPLEGVLQKLKDYDLPANGSLSFFHDWTYYTEDAGLYELETTTGPFNGLLDAYRRGSEYRERYGHLWDQHSKVPMWSAGWERVLQTARKFGEGFFQYNYTDTVAMNVILEHESQGANSLATKCPGIGDSDKCKKTKDINTMHPQAKIAAARLNSEYPGLNLTANDVHLLQEIASFEFNVRAWSPWFNVFTKEEWVGYENVRDLDFYYCAGPGADNAVPLGSVYANATLALMKEGPEKSGTMFWSFSHDTNITPMLAALGLTWPVDPDLPLDGTIPFYNQYRATDVVPMGAHLVLERMTCEKSVLNDEGVYVRAVLNEAVMPFPGCQTGPGFSCQLDDYADYVNNHTKNYIKECKVPSKYPQYLDMFWNYSTSNKYNHANGTLKWQAGEW